MPFLIEPHQIIGQFQGICDGKENSFVRAGEWFRSVVPMKPLHGIEIVDTPGIIRATLGPNLVLSSASRKGLIRFSVARFSVRLFNKTPEGFAAKGARMRKIVVAAVFGLGLTLTACGK